MKTSPHSLAVAAILASAAPCAAETPSETLEEGVFLQETKNDPAAAAEIYRQLIEEEAAGRLLAAEARYRLAICLSSLDKPAESRKLLEELIADENHSGEWAEKAVELLGQDAFIHPAPWKSGEIASYQILGPAGQKLGSMLSAIKETVIDGKPGWTSYFIRSGGQLSYSSCHFLDSDYRPTTSTAWFEGFGGSSIEFKDDGLIRVSNSQNGELRWERKPDAASPLAPAFDNDQVIQLLRAVPQKEGTKMKTHVIAPLASTPVPFNLEVVGTELAETDAGDFDCVRLKSNIGQDFLMSTDEHRRLITIIAGAARIEATEFIKWDPAETTNYKSRTNELELTFPAGVLWTPPEDKEEGLSILLFPTDMSANGGRIKIRPLSELGEAQRKSSAAYSRQSINGTQKNFDECEIVGEAETVKAANSEAVITHFNTKKGELEAEYLFLHCLTAEHAVHIRFQVTKGNVAKVRKIALEILEGLEFD